MNENNKGLTIAQSFAWNTAGSMIYLVCSWLTTVLVVIFGSDLSMSGSLAVAMSVGNIYATIVLLRARPVQVSEAYPCITSGHFVAQRILALLIATVFCFGYGLLSVSPSDYPVVVCYCIFKAIESFVDVFHGVDQINSRLDYAAISQILRGIGLLIGFTVGLVLFKSLVVAVLLMAAVSLLVVVAFDFPITARYAALAPDFDFSQLVFLFKVCVPGLVASLACTSAVSLARQLYGLTCGNEQLGIYAAVATPTVVVQALVTYLYAPLLGPLAKNWQEGNVQAIVSVIKKILCAVFVATIACILGALFLGEPVLSLIYGETVGAHSSYLSLMLVATAFTGLMFFFIDLAISFGKPAYGFISAAVALVVSVVLSKLLFGLPQFATDANIISVVILMAYGVGLLISVALIARLIRCKMDSLKEDAHGAQQG